MSDIEFKLVLDNTDEVKKAMENGIAASLEAVGMQAETYAKAKCPVDTGLLRNSLTHVIVPDEKAVYVGTPTEYAAYV